jgi:hypothetical protein
MSDYANETSKTPSLWPVERADVPAEWKDRALKAERERDEARAAAWRPISTAPKDETEFLAYDALTKKQDVCVWSDVWKEVVPVQSDGEHGPLPGEFGYDPRGIQWWMPLQQPPKDTGSS